MKIILLQNYEKKRVFKNIYILCTKHLKWIFLLFYLIFALDLLEIPVESDLMLLCVCDDFYFFIIYFKQLQLFCLFHVFE